MVKKNTCVFISGEGSNLKALIHNSRFSNFPITIKLIISNKPKAKGILLAKKNSIPYLIIDTRKRYYENDIISNIKKK